MNARHYIYRKGSEISLVIIKFFSKFSWFTEKSPVFLFTYNNSFFIYRVFCIKIEKSQKWNSALRFLSARQYWFYFFSFLFFLEKLQREQQTSFFFPCVFFSFLLPGPKLHAVFSRFIFHLHLKISIFLMFLLICILFPETLFLRFSLCLL